MDSNAYTLAISEKSSAQNQLGKKNSRKSKKEITERCSAEDGRPLKEVKEKKEGLPLEVITSVGSYNL